LKGRENFKATVYYGAKIQKSYAGSPTFGRNRTTTREDEPGWHSAVIEALARKGVPVVKSRWRRTLRKGWEEAKKQRKREGRV